MVVNRGTPSLRLAPSQRSFTSTRCSRTVKLLGRMIFVDSSLASVRLFARGGCGCWVGSQEPHRNRSYSMHECLAELVGSGGTDSKMSKLITEEGSTTSRISESAKSGRKLPMATHHRTSSTPCMPTIPDLCASAANGFRNNAQLSPSILNVSR